MAGFHTVFFPSSAMVAVLASLLVQGIELVCAERFHLAGCAAFLLSVAFSAMSFINIGTPTSVYMRHAMTTLNSAYSTQLLPDVQSAISSDMGSLYSTISGELTALRTEAQVMQEQNTANNMLTEGDYDLIRSRYNDAQKKQTEYFELDQLIGLLQNNDLERAYALMDAIEAEAGSGATLTCSPSASGCRLSTQMPPPPQKRRLTPSNYSLHRPVLIHRHCPSKSTSSLPPL